MNIQLYAVVRRQCAERGEPIAGYIERLVLADLGETVKTIPGMLAARTEPHTGTQFERPPPKNYVPTVAPAVARNACKNIECEIEGPHARVGTMVLR